MYMKRLFSFGLIGMMMFLVGCTDRRVALGHFFGEVGCLVADSENVMNADAQADLESRYEFATWEPADFLTFVQGMDDEDKGVVRTVALEDININCLEHFVADGITPQMVVNDLLEGFDSLPTS